MWTAWIHICNLNQQHVVGHPVLNPNAIADSLICGAHASITIQACCVAFNQVHAIIMCLKFGEHKLSDLQALYESWCIQSGSGNLFLDACWSCLTLEECLWWWHFLCGDGVIGGQIYQEVWMVITLSWVILTQVPSEVHGHPCFFNSGASEMWVLNLQYLRKEIRWTFEVFIHDNVVLTGN